MRIVRMRGRWRRRRQDGASARLDGRLDVVHCPSVREDPEVGALFRVGDDAIHGERIPVARAVAIGTRIERRGVRVRETDPAVVAGTSEELPAVLCAGQAVKVRS